MSGVTSGRAPSCIITHRVGASFVRLSSPLRTESCLRIPPSTMLVILLQPSFWQSLVTSSSRSELSTSTMLSMMGEASNTSIVRESVIRPASGVQSLSRPSMRRLEPAAAIIAEDFTCISQLLLWFGGRRLGGVDRRKATYPPLLFWVCDDHLSRD